MHHCVKAADVKAGSCCVIVCRNFFLSYFSVERSHWQLYLAVALLMSVVNGLPDALLSAWYICFTVDTCHILLLRQCLCQKKSLKKIHISTECSQANANVWCLLDGKGVHIIVQACQDAEDKLANGAEASRQVAQMYHDTRSSKALRR